MSDKSEAAQKWAEAKERLETAVAASDTAQQALGDALMAEKEAWEALEMLSGRTPPVHAAPILNGPFTYVTGGPGEPTRGVGQMLAQRHSLPVKPIG